MDISIYGSMFLILLLPCWQRLAGQGGSVYLSRAPQVLAMIACLSVTSLAFPWVLVQGVLLYLALETGHGIALGMGSSEHIHTDDKRTQRLLPLVNLLNNMTKYPFQSRAWCRLFFGVKGFLIGCCLFPAGLILTILWPMCYQGSTDKNKVLFDLKGTALSEYCTGYALMVCIVLNTALNGLLSIH